MNTGLTGLAALEAEMHARLKAKDAEIERLSTVASDADVVHLLVEIARLRAALLAAHAVLARIAKAHVLTPKAELMREAAQALAQAP